MAELTLPQVCAEIERAFGEQALDRVENLLWPALEQFPDLSQLWFYGGCFYFKVGRVAVAGVMFRRAIELDDAPHVYSNLGACFRRMNMIEEGRRVLATCLERIPDDAPALTNMGSTYVNEGTPELGIPYLEKAVKIGGERGAKWNLGLLYLEAARFGEGFDCYRTGVSHERQVRQYGLDPEPKLLKPEDERAGKRLIVWGEQGIGDELMFGSVLEDARREFAEVIFECHPRLAELHASAHHGLTLRPTRKDESAPWARAEGVQADYKCPIGDLAAYYRRDVNSFATAWDRYGGAIYSSDTEEMARYRRDLLELADGKPIIGLATRGGVIQTARVYRTMRAPEAEFLFGNTDCLFVALDYDDMSGFANHVAERFGPHRYKWWPSIVQHWDYHHTAALVEACDLVVTVCQSVAHLSAGLGHPTRVLVPKRCAWRYAPIEQRERWYWYPDPDIRLYRQDDPKSWKGPLEKAVRDINLLSVKP